MKNTTTGSASDVSDIVIDLDKMLSETHRENLQDMSLALPSEVIRQRNYETVLKQITTLNRQCGQYTLVAIKLSPLS